MPSRHLLAVLVLTTACAARGPSPQTVAEIAKGDALFRAGCYTCLTEALTIYQKHKVSQGIFDASLLIAIREKELGIPADDALRLVRELPSEAPSLAQGGSRSNALLAGAQLVVGETSGLDPVQRAALMGGRPPIDKDHPRRRALDPWFGKDVVATYVALTLDCESSRLIESVDMAGLTKIYEGQPLMQFRLSRCGRPAQAQHLATLRATDPRWTDTLFWEARREMVGSPTTGIDFPKALSLFAEGRAAFPTSLALTMSWANVSMSAEEFETALSGFDEVLSVYPEHRDALIGRVTSLSYLLRHPDAVTTATRVIELGTWHIGDAYYWRAWNRYNLKEYETAWADVETAIKGLSNTRVYTLAGLIAYARKELPVAVQRFDRAYEIDSSNCDATWMSGLVNIDQELLAMAAPKFTRAMSCFVSSAAALRENLALVERQLAARGTPATPREVRQQARLKRDAENADERSAQSAFNAAQCYARTGGRTMALNLVDVAIAHPRMNEKAVALKAAIEKLPQ
jgi:tetratricopeptide (TPR) repeat protein